MNNNAPLTASQININNISSLCLFQKRFFIMGLVKAMEHNILMALIYSQSIVDYIADFPVWIQYVLTWINTVSV